MSLPVVRVATETLQTLVVFVGAFAWSASALQIFLGISGLGGLAFLAIANLGLAATAVSWSGMA
jgi:hypothetical protein